MDPEVTMQQYGLVVAADATAQMIFSPLFGVVADKMGQIRVVCLFCTITFCGGNVFYSLISLIPSSGRVWCMLAARFIVGIGTGNKRLLLKYL